MITMATITGCRIKLDYKPCVGCPFEARPGDCRYWMKEYGAKYEVG